MTRQFTSPYISDMEVDPFVIACRRCGRRGRYRIASAIAQYGDRCAPDFLRVVSADCPNRASMVDQIRYERAPEIAAVDDGKGRGL
jgi:hypothetical protein